MPRGALAARPVPATRSARALPAAGAWERPGLSPGAAGPARATGPAPGPSRAVPGPRGIPFGFVQKANPEANSSPPRPSARARALLCGGDSGAPFPATLPWAGGQTARPEAGEALRRRLAGRGLGAQGRRCAELDAVRPRRPASCRPQHNKSAENRVAAV